MVENRDFFILPCIRRPVRGSPAEYYHIVWCAKTRMVCLPDSDMYKSQLSSLDFIPNRFSMKLFNTSDMQTVKFCRVHFNFELPSNKLIRRYKNFLDNATAKTDLVKYFCV